MQQTDYSTTDIVYQGETVGRVEDGVFYSQIRSSHISMVMLDRNHLELVRQAGARWIVITDKTGATRKALIEDCEQPGYINTAFPWALMVPLSIFNETEKDEISHGGTA